MFKKEYKLVLFENSEPSNTPAISITGELLKYESCLEIIYRIQGDLNLIRWPNYNPDAKQANGLWEHTCFEFFLAKENNNQYFEFNFSPSTAWAVLSFSNYREEGSPYVSRFIPIEFNFENHCSAILKATIPLFDNLVQYPLNIGISAVIENTDEQLSYYALTHCGKRPDFHNRNSFVLYVPTTNA